jgi:signal transduction histidine kinase
MSHEIRTPLNAILGFSNILASNEGISDNEKKEYFEYIKTNNNLLLQIINDILDISMIEAETIDFNNTKSDINDVLKSIEVSFKLKLKDNGSKLNVIFEKKDPECILFIDRNRLLQVINNLINNAIKFTDEGDIRFGYTKENDQITRNPVLRFFVTDTGIGIPEDKIDSVFDRFIKLSPEKVGSGLGLSIAKSIVNHYNGQIGVISEVGKGSTFWFTIPCI